MLAGAMKSSSQAKSMIKDKNTLLENSGKVLFGKDFCNQITDTVKAQKQSKEMLLDVFQQQRANKPFSKNISFKRRSDDSRRGYNSYNKAHFKNTGNQSSSLLQRNSTTSTITRVVISTLIDKKIILQFKDSNSTTGREVSALPGQLGKTNKRSEYRIPFFCRPKQKMEPKEMNFSMQEKATISLEVENLLKKGTVEQVCPQKEQFLNNIYSEKEGWGQQTCDQLEGVFFSILMIIPIH